MNRAAKIALGVSGLTVAGLIALAAVPMIASAESPTTEATREAVSTPTPTPTPVEPTATPAPEPAGTQSTEQCTFPLAYDGLSVGVSLMDGVVLHDHGAQPGATGQTVLDGSGDPAAYVVADGDTQTGIEARFCAAPGYLSLLNSVRRTDVYVEPQTVEGYVWPDPFPEGTGWIMDLYAGDTLNLNPHTVLTVGDQEGVVYQHEPDVQMPEQW
ncbi:hypothetical protein [Microbacterium terregens]|uniref:Secreted protein n=1 Tax=Microbacterium terregens TaxID=69363 RepID=A0ABV5SXJ4_9MICO